MTIKNQTLRQQLTAQRDALLADLTQAGAIRDQAAVAAEPVLRRRRNLDKAVHISSSGSMSHAEREAHNALLDADARVVAVEDELRLVERELAKLDAAAQAVADGAQAEKAMAKAEAKVKSTTAHLARVRQLQQIKLAELDKAAREQQKTDSAAAAATVAALLGTAVPQVSPGPEKGAVEVLERELVAIRMELKRAEGEAEAAQTALDALVHPMLHARLVKGREAFTQGLDALMVHLNDWYEASGRLGWGWRAAEAVDLPTALRAWRQARGLPA